MKEQQINKTTNMVSSNGRVRIFAKRFLRQPLRRLKNLLFQLSYSLYYGHKIVLLESQQLLGGNSGALYNYLQTKRAYRKWVFVFLMLHYDGKSFKNQHRLLVFPTNYSSRKKDWLVKHALISFFDDVPVRSGKKGALTIYLTHGCPALKNVKGIINLPQYVDYAICTSQELIPLMSDQFSFPKEKFFVGGLPRNDVLFAPRKDLSSIIDCAGYDKVVLWTPTFRKALYSNRNDSSKSQPFGVPLLSSRNDIDALESKLSSLRMLLVIKPHPYQDTETIGALSDCSHIQVLLANELSKKGVSVNDLFLYSDALISDYSSIAFDYLLTDKPLAFITDDLGEYKLGLVDHHEAMMPGVIINTLDSLLLFLDQLAGGMDSFNGERAKARNSIHSYQNGQYCKRIEELFLERPKR